MKFKTKFARIVSELQQVEAVVSGDSLEEAEAKFEAGDYDRFLVMKRELKDTSLLGKTEFERLT